MEQYNRKAAVAYARRWAFDRNPKFMTFDGMGGDCTNFASQCVHAGGAPMNFTRNTGWYFINADDRSPAWSGVRFLRDFLLTNKGAGPIAKETELSDLLPGDVIFLYGGQRFFHSLVVLVNAGYEIFVAAHTSDEYGRALSTYIYEDTSAVHIIGVNPQ